MKLNEPEAGKGLSLNKFESTGLSHNVHWKTNLRIRIHTREKSQFKLLGRTQYNVYLLKTVTSRHGYLRLLKGVNQPGHK